MRIDEEEPTPTQRYVKATATFAPPPKSTFNPPRQTKIVHLGSDDDDEDDDVEVLVPATPVEQEEDDRLGELWSEQLHDLRLLEKQLPALVKDPIERARIMAIRPAEQRLLHLSRVRSADLDSRIPLHRPEDDRLGDLAGPGERERLEILEHQLPVGHPDLAIKPAARRYERLMANLRMGTLTIDLNYEKGLFEHYPMLCSGKPQRILFPPRPGQADPFLVCTLPTKAGGDRQVIPETQEPASEDYDNPDRLDELTPRERAILDWLESQVPPTINVSWIRPAKKRLAELQADYASFLYSQAMDKKNDVVVPETQEPASDDPSDKLSDLTESQVGLLRDLEALLPAGHPALKITPAKFRLRYLFWHLSLDEDARPVFSDPFLNARVVSDKQQDAMCKAFIEGYKASGQVGYDEDPEIIAYTAGYNACDKGKKVPEGMIRCFLVHERKTPDTLDLRRRDIDPTTHYIFASSTSDIKLAVKADEWLPIVKKTTAPPRKPPTKGPDGLTSRQRAERRALARGCSWTKWN
jgi:hypothetical protein